MSGSTCIVVGGQYGSEGKGNICRKIADDFSVHVRTGGPNAGHTFRPRPGHEPFKHQVLPVGWVNSQACLIIGRGALVPLRTLVREIGQAAQLDPTVPDRVLLDEQAGVLEPEFSQIEGGTSGKLHDRIGSTGKGVGVGRQRRIQRNPATFRHLGACRQELQSICQSAGLADLTQRLHPDTPAWMREASRKGESILVEGTQGTGLSLLHGPWPYVTSADTTASGFAAEAGLPARLVDSVILVIRTMPIRVGGNSGPLHNEITWEQLSQRLGREVLEHTTVTGKVRRIGEWDPRLVETAVQLNAPSSLAINFMDYRNPEDYGVEAWENLSPEGKQFVKHLENRFDTPVSLVGTGGEQDWRVIRREGVPL